MYKITRNIIILLLFLHTSAIYCISVDEISNYELVIIKQIKYGDKKGELGIGVNEVGPGITLNAGPMTWGENKKVYILDGNNQRINVYDSQFNYLKEINFYNKKNTLFLRYISSIAVDKNENIFLSLFGIDGKELIIIKSDGEWEKLFDANGPRDVLDKYNFFSFGDSLLYYENKSIKFINLTGSKSENNVNPNEISYLINENGEKNASIIQEESIDQKTLISFLKENNSILKGNRLLSKEFEKYFKYKSYIKEKLKSKRQKEKIIIDKKFRNMIFLGFDADDNVYWKGSVVKGTQIIIFNKYGEIIDVIKIEKPGSPNISPAGDIYYLGGDDEKEYINIYKITRQW